MEKMYIIVYTEIMIYIVLKLIVVKMQYIMKLVYNYNS